MPDPAAATAADYSEALLTARRAKNLLCLILAVMIAGQIAAFLLLRYEVVKLPTAATVAAPLPATPAVVATQPAVVGDLGDVPPPSTRMVDLLHYLTGVMVLGGVALPIVLALVLLLITHIMLVGRLIGVGRVTGALVWTLVLLVFLFPWQAFMNNADLTLTDFRVPGVLWTWGELVRRYKFDAALNADHWADTVLFWFRFIGAPVVALVLVLVVQLKSNRGLRMALGEDEVLNEMLRRQ